jgi:hypothetical protein
MRIDAEANVIFFKNYTRILGLLKKSARLRLAVFSSSIGSNSLSCIPAAHYDAKESASISFEQTVGRPPRCLAG